MISPKSASVNDLTNIMTGDLGNTDDRGVHWGTVDTGETGLTEPTVFI